MGSVQKHAGCSLIYRFFPCPPPPPLTMCINEAKVALTASCTASVTLMSLSLSLKNPG